MKNDFKQNNPNIQAKAPFNFAPLPTEIFVPNWAEKISQDVPFRDGMSGSISLQITAESDIFVRNGHTQADKDKKSDTYKSFSKDPDNRYFIPATSLKGTIRSVMEIMSFSAMTQVNDSVFGQRDLMNNDYRKGVSGSNCGWLRVKNGKYILKDCGKPKRVRIWDIDKDLNLKYDGKLVGGNGGRPVGGELTNFIINGKFDKDEDKCAHRKYKVVYETLSPAEKEEDYDYVNNMKARDDSGIYVLTGQPAKPKYDPNRKKPVASKKSGNKGGWTNKVSEFLFPGTATKGGNEIVIDEETFSRFAEVHKNSLDFTEFWSKRLNRGLPIPVFFHKEGKKVIHMGLSYMYKIPFKKSVTQAIPDYKEGLESRDMARCIFGDTSLSGRVMFGNAYALGTPKPTEERITMSCSPHASFYPLYMRKGDWNSDNAQVSGWKRYPVRMAVQNQNSNNDNEGTDDMKQKSCFLPQGTQFEATVRFVNLRPAELGALLSALTWHGDTSCRHGIGFGKPYGYGVTKIEACLDGNLKGREVGCMKAFQKTMNGFCSGNWLASDTMTQLFAMARPIDQADNVKFSYLKMSTNKNDNEFANLKKVKKYLKPFTEILPPTK